jgi:hypothetical protein
VSCAITGPGFAQAAPPLNHGSFRFGTPAVLTVKTTCAIGMKNGDVLVVMTDAPIDCAGAARKADPTDAALNSGPVAARIHFTVKAGGTVEHVFLANVTGASTYTDDAHVTFKAGPRTPTRIAGVITSGGVRKIQVYEGEREMQYDVSFDTPVIKAAK